MKAQFKQFLNLSILGVLSVLIVACSGRASTSDSLLVKKTTPDLIIEPIHISTLNRNRMVRILLPKGYHQITDKAYPVIYMLDGQNLFEDSTSYVGEWHVDESMDTLSKQGIEAIIVGIDNGQDHRMREYNPFDHPRYGTQEGQLFIEYMIEELKPQIDSTYRTLTDKMNTCIIGSSMGALISFYAIAEYPDVFGNAGVFSPSFWVSEEVSKLPEAINDNTRIYMVAGEMEGTGMVKALNEMKAGLLKTRKDSTYLYAEIIPEMEHNEKFWTIEFPKAMKWFFKQQ